MLADLASPATAALESEMKLGEAYSAESGLAEKLKLRGEDFR